MYLSKEIHRQEEEEDCETHLGDVGGTEKRDCGGSEGIVSGGEKEISECRNNGDSNELGFKCLGVDF